MSIFNRLEEPAKERGQGGKHGKGGILTLLGTIPDACFLPYRGSPLFFPLDYSIGGLCPHPPNNPMGLGI